MSTGTKTGTGVGTPFNIDFLEQEAIKIANDIPKESDLSNISDLAKRQLYLEELTKRLENLQETVKANLGYVSQRLLPEAILSTGISEFKLDDGTKISVHKRYFPSVKDEVKEEAYGWLVENGYDIIKNEVKVTFAKGQDEEALKIYQELAQQGLNVNKAETIHWQTFRAWAKEMMEKGVQIPETINVHVVDEAVIKRSK